MRADIILAPETEKALRDLQAFSGELEKARGLMQGDVLPGKPEGWFTLEELCPEGLNLHTANTRVRNLVRAGKMESLKAYCVATDGKLRVTNVYRPR